MLKIACLYRSHCAEYAESDPRASSVSARNANSVSELVSKSESQYGMLPDHSWKGKNMLGYSIDWNAVWTERRSTGSNETKRARKPLE